jgi:glucose dehydrogenase
LGGGWRKADAERHYHQYRRHGDRPGGGCAKRIYTTNADGELLTIDSESNKILSRKKLQDDGKEHFYLNLSLDTAGHRAFITDSKQPEVLVVDLRDGKVLRKSPRRNPWRCCSTRRAMKPT